MSYFIGVLLLSFFVFTHGDLDQRILEKSNQIALHPHDRQLYLERGELYLVHEEYVKAKADFSFCLDRQWAYPRVYIGMSKSLFYLHNSDSALIFVQRALSMEEKHLSALELKGMILSGMGNYCEAASTMEKLLSVADQPSPQLFLEAAYALESCSEKGTGDRAIHILNDGIRRLGNVGVIQKQIVALYKRMGRFEEAVLVQTNMIEQSELKIRPYFERARLYIEMESKDKAKDDLIIAMTLFDQLPEYKKSLSSMQSMRN